MSDVIIVNVLALLGTISTAVSALLIAVVSKQRHETKKTNKTIERVRDQVENSHGTNMRDDLDVIRNEIRAMASVQRSTASDVRGIRSDFGRLDRRSIEGDVERRELESRFNKHIEWSHSQENRLGHLERTGPGAVPS